MYDESEKKEATLAYFEVLSQQKHGKITVGSYIMYLTILYRIQRLFRAE
jgi:hypothetical protein